MRLSFNLISSKEWKNFALAYAAYIPYFSFSFSKSVIFFFFFSISLFNPSYSFCFSFSYFSLNLSSSSYFLLLLSIRFTSFSKISLALFNSSIIVVASIVIFFEFTASLSNSFIEDLTISFNFSASSLF